jgi:hypothetical protein
VDVDDHEHGLLVVPDRRIAQEDDVGKESIQRYLRLECVVGS